MKSSLILSVCLACAPTFAQEQSLSPGAGFTEIALGSGTLLLVKNSLASSHHLLTELHAIESQLALKALTRTEALGRLTRLLGKTYGPLLAAGVSILLIVDGCSYLLTQGRVSFLGYLIRSFRSKDPEETAGHFIVR